MIKIELFLAAFSLIYSLALFFFLITPQLGLALKGFLSSPSSFISACIFAYHLTVLNLINENVVASLVVHTDVLMTAMLKSV